MKSRKVTWEAAIMFITLLLRATWAEEAEHHSLPNAPPPTYSSTSLENDLYTIEGKLVYVKSQDTKAIDSIKTKVAADGSQYYGFLRFVTRFI